MWRHEEVSMRDVWESLLAGIALEASLGVRGVHKVLLLAAPAAAAVSTPSPSTTPCCSK